MLLHGLLLLGAAAGGLLCSAVEGLWQIKTPFLALTLSFSLPGAGLWYLGRRGWATANLLVLLAVGLIAALTLFEDNFDRTSGPLGAACRGGFGGLAMTLAQLRDQVAEAHRHAERGNARDGGEIGLFFLFPVHARRG